METNPAIVDRNDVAGIVPSIHKRTQRSRLVGVKVSQHDVGAAHEQPSPTLDARHRFDPVFDARQQPAGRVGAAVHRGIQRQHRRGFRGAIAFQDAHAESVGEQAFGLLPHFFRAGEDVAHGIEVVRMRVTSPPVEECIGTEANGGVGVVDQTRNDPVMQRAGIVKRSHAGDQRQDRGAGQTKRVKHRHRVEHRVAAVKVDHRRQLRAVGENVAMTEHDSLWIALRPAGEQHDRRRGGIGVRTGQPPRQPGIDFCDQLRAKAQSGADVFQPDEPHFGRHTPRSGGTICRVKRSRGCKSPFRWWRSGTPPERSPRPPMGSAVLVPGRTPAIPRT